MPLWCAWPGPRIEAPKPPTTPTITRSLPRTHAAVSGPPRPFWIDRTGVSPFTRTGRCSGGRNVHRFRRKDDQVARPGVARIGGGVEAHGAVAGSAFHPQPARAHRVDVSFQRSMAHTSWPAQAKSAAYTEPIAPVPTIAIFNFFSNHFEQPRRAHAAADAHRDHDELRAAALAFDERVADEARAAHAVGMADARSRRR